MAKTAASAFPFPLAQGLAQRLRVTLWGQVRPRRGAQPYRLQVNTGGTWKWKWSGGTSTTNSLGFLSRAVPAAHGSLVRLWSPRDKAFSWPIVAR